ncbi:MAG: C1 family peptidase [Elusimicrobia bacterium]|nr:C1 family peptidase [Elusimicrobiota bacterium]
MKNNKKLFVGFQVFAALFACNAFSFAQSSASENSKEQIEHIQYLIKQTGAKWVAGETSLSNLSQEEWKWRLGLNLDPVDAPLAPLAETELPPAIDWRNFNGNYVTPVKDQKKCGSCWAFAMTGALESYVLRTQNTPGADVDLSEQVMLSCSGAGSCSGGLLNAGFIKKTGLPPESYYAYTATNGSCKTAAEGWQNAAHKILDWGSVSKKLTAIKTALVQHGPLPTAMMVYEDFMHYKSGIYSYVTGKKLGGHAILLVGYNDAEQYFIVKNSWDTDWGENGFFRIAYSQMDNSVSFGMRTIAYYVKNTKIEFLPEPEQGYFEPAGTWRRFEPILQEWEKFGK